MKFYLLLQLLSLAGLALAKCNDHSIGSRLGSTRADHTRPSCGESSVNRRRHHHLKIIGGRQAEPGEFPYQVWLWIDLRTGRGVKASAGCGGVIIDEWHILTAAHCVGNGKFLLAEATALVGVHDLSRKGHKEIPIKASLVHQHGHQDGDERMDIALFRTAEPMEFGLHGLGSVNSICLPEMNEDLAPVGSLVTISGLVNEDQYADVLQTTQVRVEDYSGGGCGNHTAMGQEHELCLATLPGRTSNACHGDSGGPAAIKRDGKWYLVGLTSRAGPDDCTTYKANPDLKTIYTRVSAFIDWIEETKLRLAATS